MKLTFVCMQDRQQSVVLMHQQSRPSGTASSMVSWAWYIAMSIVVHSQAESDELTHQGINLSEQSVDPELTGVLISYMHQSL